MALEDSFEDVFNDAMVPAEPTHEDSALGDAPVGQGSGDPVPGSEDDIVQGLIDVLTEDGDPTVREGESLIEANQEDKGDRGEKESEDGSDERLEDSEGDTEGGKEEKAGESETDDEESDPEGSGDDESGDNGASDESGEGGKGGRANERIQQLIARAKAAEQERDEARARAEEAEKRAATTTNEHPDPEKEVADLRETYKNIMTPDQVLSSGKINPLTGAPYTPAEAQAAIAELKQDIQFKIDEANNAVVERMNQAREAERLGNQLVPPLQDLITKFPMLDPDNPKADKDLCALLQMTIDANTEKRNGLLSGFVSEPEEFLAGFERVLNSLGKVKVNGTKRVDNAIDKTPDHGALDSRRDDGKMKIEDEMMNAFDDTLKEIGF